MTTKITLDSIVAQQNDKLLGSDLGDEIIMMDIEKGDYFGLNQVASAIWKLMSNPIKVSDICLSLCEEYDINKKDCEIATIKFLNQLIDEKIVSAN